MVYKMNSVEFVKCNSNVELMLKFVDARRKLSETCEALNLSYL